MGEVAIARVGSKHVAQIARAMSVSLNGIGLKNCKDLKVGDHVQISLKSFELDGIVHAQAVVLYVGKNGDCGLRFEEIGGESKALIDQHVRHFLDSDRAAA